MKVIKYSENPEILEQISQPVTKFDKDLISLVNEMFSVIKIEKGIGLAAIQLGIPKKVMVIHNPFSGLRIAIINPTYQTMSEETLLAAEGCLSAPGKYKEIRRYNHISVDYVNLQNKPQSRELFGLDSRIFQHEYDHFFSISIFT
jgi:peptide deformylase